MNRFLIVTALLVFAAAPAWGAVFTAVVPEKSTMNFVARQMNVPLEGRFKKFSSQVVFDPAKPETGKAQIEIDLASIDSGMDEIDDEAKGKAWFDVSGYPSAKFVASGVRSLGGNRFEANGKLSIKGKTRDIVAPFTAKTEGGMLVIDGGFPIMRLQYGIGDGAWSDTTTVADEVQVRFHLTLSAASPPKN